MRVNVVTASILAWVIAAAPPLATAQSLASRLSQLTSEQALQGSFPDVQASSATSDAITKIVRVELGSLPAPTSSAGVVYQLDPSLGTVARTSEGLGPLFSERAFRSAKGRLSGGFAFQVTRFSSLNGENLTTGAFPIGATRVSGIDPPFSVDRLTLQLERQSTTVFADYGIGGRLTVGAALPLVRVQVSGSRVRMLNGRATAQTAQVGWAVGLGDATVNARLLVAGNALRGASVGADVRLPTGREENLLGTGRLGTRVLGVGSWEAGPWGVSVNGGYSLGGLARVIDWTGAATLAAGPRITLVGEILGRRVLDAHVVEAVWQSHSTVSQLDTLRWMSGNRAITSSALAAGARWNVAGPWLLNANVLINVANDGLAARLTPGVSLGYYFDL